MSNLRLINETEITASTSSVSITDVFSSDFDIYKIVVNGLSTDGTTNTEVHFRFINAGGRIVNNNQYHFAVFLLRSDQTYGDLRDTSDDSLRRLFGVNSDQAPETANGVAYVYNPFKDTSYSFVHSQSTTNYNNLHRNNNMVGYLDYNASMTGFNLHEASTRPLISGVIRTYGLRVDS